MTTLSILQDSNPSQEVRICFQLAYLKAQLSANWKHDWLNTSLIMRRFRCEYESTTRKCVLHCFIKPILGPGVSLHEPRRHTLTIENRRIPPTYLLTLSSLKQPAAARSSPSTSIMSLAIPILPFSSSNGPTTSLLTIRDFSPSGSIVLASPKFCQPHLLAS